ncbi:MAG: ureidoglycolate lyase [Roseovarius sp.]
MSAIHTEPLTAPAFAPFGTVIARRATPDRMINHGLCARHHDLARPDILEGAAGISLFQAEPRALPYRLEMMERHPLGSQSFLPMYETRFLVTVAPDEGGRPGAPRAFLTAPGEGVQIGRNIWHGVLTPLEPPGLFAVIDRIGDGPNLEEHWLDTPVTITSA